MRIDELDYELPEALIAQAPPANRDGARLLCVDRSTGALAHRRVVELASLIPPSLIVVNDTRVFPARLLGTRTSGGQVEILLIERIGEPGRDELWLTMGRASKPLRVGTEISFGGGALSACIEERLDGGRMHVRLRLPPARDANMGAAVVMDAVEQVGAMPLPPYIRRAADHADKERYQTVFAREPGAIAAPTAGLHLTHELLQALKDAGHQLAQVTLHVGPGTFAPLRHEQLAEHPMHRERFHVPSETAQAIARAKRDGRAVLAIGTTVVRTLESAANAEGVVREGWSDTALFIYPPYRFRVVDALLTNFHLPRSTLLALVMAFAGADNARAAYASAVAERYRFFSYGDAMLIQSGATATAAPGAPCN